MTDHIRDLLDDLADDGDRPLGFTPGEIARRGGAARRRRTSVYAAAGVSVALVATIGATQVLGTGGGSEGNGPAPADRSSTTTVADPEPSLTPEQQAIVKRCSKANQEAEDYRVAPPPPADGSADDSKSVDPGSAGSEVIVDDPAKIPDRVDLSTWTLDAHLSDAQGTTATFVSADERSYAVCDLFDQGIEGEVDRLSLGRPLPQGPVPDTWHGSESFRHTPTTNWSQVCGGGEGKVCAKEIFYGGFVLFDQVASVRVEAPDGRLVTPPLGEHTYVLRHVENRVDANRPASDMQPLPSMPVNYLAADGSRIVRFDYHAAYEIPDHCLDNEGGC